MVKFSDIFKDKDKKASQTSSSKDSQKLAHLKETSASRPEIKDEKIKIHHDISISSIIKEKPDALATIPQEPRPEGSNIYQEAVDLAERIIKLDLNIHEICDLIKKLIDNIQSGNQQLLEYSLNNSNDASRYFSYHLVNVTILSLEVGLTLGFDRSKLTCLGGISFLHDVGLIKHLELINQPKRLSVSEYEIIKTHPIDGIEILKKIEAEIAKVCNIECGTVFLAIQQEHEREDGSGYPKGIENDNINEFAKIIGLADTYEALTHLRPYRDKYNPLDAINIILDSKKKFDRKLIKALVERIGLYPKGTKVELNTKEKAKVIKQNHDVPLRPLIMITNDADGKSLERPKEIDLLQHPAIYIVKSL